MASTDSQRLINKLRTLGLLSKSPVELVRTPRNRGQSRRQWQWYARNPLNKHSYGVGSPHRMEELLRAEPSKLGVTSTAEGRTIIILGAYIEAKSSRQDELRSYKCNECGAPPGQPCLVRGKPSAGTIHVSRIRKWQLDHG